MANQDAADPSAAASVERPNAPIATRKQSSDREDSAEAAAREPLLARLRETLAPERVIADSERLRLLARDFLSPWRAVPADVSPPQTPLAAVRPTSTAEVAAVVRVAAAAGVPLVELGGGTGLMGGARSVQPGIVLDLRGLNRIIAISAEDRCVHVEAGVVLADLGAALEPHGLIVGHDPWTYPIATVGGTISTNGLGYLGGKYGPMGDQTLGLTVVLANGAIVTTRPAQRSSTGPRLRALFAGAEGTLGVITEAALRVFPRPEAEKLTAYRFAGFDEGFRAIQALAAAGIAPAVLDFGQTYAGERHGRSVVTPTGAPGLLILGFHGLAEEVKAVHRRARALLEAHGAERLPGKRARRFWRERHVVAEEIRARQQAEEVSPDWLPTGALFDFAHIWLPPSQALRFKAAAERLLTEHGVSIGEWGLWHGPDLFSVTMFRNAPDTAEREAFAAGIDALLRLAQDMGGSMEYCHGAGLRLAHLMPRELGSGMDLLRDIKVALDPGGLLNPGKLGL